MPAATKTCVFCGATGQDGAFCDECGEKLPSAPVAVGEEPARERGSGDTWDIPVMPSSDGRTLASGDRTTIPHGDQRSVSVSDVGDRRPAPGSGSGDRARALIVPVGDPASGQPGGTASPVLPGRPEPATPAVARVTEAEVSAGGRPCPWCGTPNPVDRHFCRRCAMSLAAKPDGPARRPWWRRLLDWRRGEVPYAGQRPRLRGNPGRLVRWAVTLAVVGAVAIAAATWGGTAVTDVSDHFAGRSIVFANTVTASHSDPGHPAGMLHDSYYNTWWGAGESGTGSGVHVDASFNQPIDLLDIVITPGTGTTQDSFTAQSRPQTILVTLTNADGTATSTTVTIPDSPGAKTLAIHGGDVTGIRFTIESSYLEAGGTRTEVAIAEIEFFAKS